jgi:hypothetical protein
MPRLPPRRAAAILLAGLLPLLAGCGPGKDQFAPVCPRADLLRQAADIGRYRDESASATQDIRDLVLAGRITAIAGKCQPGDTARQLDADVSVSMQFTRGPAMQGREADVPFFVAITAGDQIFTKKVYTAHVVFTANVDQATWNTDPIHMVFPISPTKSGAAYTVLAGFQLTEQELAFNRRHGGGRP